MAGVGRAPKAPERRARGAQTDKVVERHVTVEKVPQPSLQSILGNVNPVTDNPWTQATLKLWRALDGFPSTDMLQLAQWHLLARAMMIDDAMVSGDIKYASEARLEISKFGIAPDDVARLRIVFAQAEIMDPQAKATGTASKARKRPTQIMDPYGKSTPDE